MKRLRRTMVVVGVMGAVLLLGADKFGPTQVSSGFDTGFTLVESKIVGGNSNSLKYETDAKDISVSLDLDVPSFTLDMWRAQVRSQGLHVTRLYGTWIRISKSNGEKFVWPSGEILHLTAECVDCVANPVLDWKINLANAKGDSRDRANRREWYFWSYLILLGLTLAGVAFEAYEKVSGGWKIGVSPERALVSELINQIELNDEKWTKESKWLLRKVCLEGGSLDVAYRRLVKQFGRADAWRLWIMTRGDFIERLTTVLKDLQHRLKRLKF